MDIGRGRRRIVFFDLDNTLYDWLGFFAPAFRGLCQRLSETANVSSPRLYEEFKEVFTRRRSVEYTFAIQELPSIRERHGDLDGPDVLDRFADAVAVFQHRREANLKLYHGVADGLRRLKDAGFEVWAVTDSHGYQASRRLHQLQIDVIFDGLACQADHAIPSSEEVGRLRERSAGSYEPRIPVVLTLPVRKPSAAVLRLLMNNLSVRAEDCLYVGDSLSKDIVMAQAAGVYDCWARYGTRTSTLDFNTLVRITDWSPDAVRAVRRAVDSARIRPSFVADEFSEVVQLAFTDSKYRPKRRELPSKVRARPGQLALFELGPDTIMEDVS